MSDRFNFSLGRVFSAVALMMAIATPVFAGNCDCPGYYRNHGQHPGMYGGMQGCPLLRDEAAIPRGFAHGMPHGFAPMGGKTLGVMISNLSNENLDDIGISYGIEVNRVQPESAAAAAGIQAGDLIVEFAGKPVISAERLRWLVRQAETGKALEIKLMRDGKPLTVNVSLDTPEPPTHCKPRDSKASGT